MNKYENASKTQVVPSLFAQSALRRSIGGAPAALNGTLTEQKVSSAREQSRNKKARPPPQGRDRVGNGTTGQRQADRPKLPNFSDLPVEPKKPSTLTCIHDAHPRQNPGLRMCRQRVYSHGASSKTGHFSRREYRHAQSEMRYVRVMSLLFLWTVSLYSQFTAQNPLDELRDQVAQVLADAGVPFSQEQQGQLALFIEEQRQASEDLFGVIMDFSAGPPQGEQRDRALAGIQWMHDAFRRRLPDFLTTEQRTAWEKFESSGKALAARIEGAGVAGANVQRIQQIRIVNNPYNAETATSGVRGPSGGGERTEIIQRGGVGAYHGNFMAAFKDESLNARNPFAANKPPYHERTINGNFSGPLISNRLTINFTVDDNRQENVGTVKVERLEGPFALGITRPVVNRYYEGRGILQLSDANSLHFGFKYGMNSHRNENIGDFTLPERGSNSDGRTYDFDLRQISVLSDRSVHEVRFAWRKDRSETNPITTAVAINVLDAFNGGGGQNRSEDKGRVFELGNLFYHVGESVTLRSGFNIWHRRESTLRESNYLGEFTFSDLESYRLGKPLQYRVTRGNPLLEMSQLQIAAFLQNDLRMSNRFTLFLGLRYEAQTNLNDKNNVDPRIGFAYAIGRSTVIRGGTGLFHTRLSIDMFRTLRRLDGTRQYEILIDQPAWPDPFVSGNVRIVPPSSRRVAAPQLANQYYATTSISVERSLPGNLFVTVGGDFNRGIHLPRARNLNAPLPDTRQKPFPAEGHIFQTQSSGVGTHKNFRIGLRERFSIFNVTANYTFSSTYNDDGKGGTAGTEGQGFDLPMDSYNLRADWGRTGFSPKHNFTAAINARLPLDVYLTTNITARTRSLYNITTGKDDNGDGVANDRPAGVPRNSGDGPGFHNVSFNLSKAFPLSRAPGSAGARNGNTGPQASLFANLNNAFNMTHLGTPSGVMTSPFFGKSFNATLPREIEAGLRFQF